MPQGPWHSMISETDFPYASRIITDISDNDGMFQRNSNHHYSCGASALSCILHSLELAGDSRPKRVLDFGSGAGRVTRWLCAAFPDAEIEACDITQADLAFIEKTFSVAVWESTVDPNSLNSNGNYDLIWVGSVFTHLSADLSVDLFHKLMSWLAPDGVLIFSVHGRFVFHRMNSGADYGLENLNLRVTNGYAFGYGYKDYPGQSGYGISVSRPTSWVGLIEQNANQRLVLFAERAWDGHHDVVAVQNQVIAGH